MYKLRYNSRGPLYFIWSRNVLKEDEIYTQSHYPASKLILIPLYFKNRRVNFFTVKLVIHFYFCVCQSRNGSLQNCNLWHKNDGRCIYCKRLMGTQRQNVPNYLRSDTNGYLHALEICMVNLELWPLKTIYLFRCVKGTLSAASQECLFLLSYLDRFGRTFEDMELSSLRSWRDKHGSAVLFWQRSGKKGGYIQVNLKSRLPKFFDILNSSQPGLRELLINHFTVVGLVT